MFDIDKAIKDIGESITRATNDENRAEMRILFSKIGDAMFQLRDQQLSARRWDALISSGRIRVLGRTWETDAEKDGEYRHVGLELWSKYNYTKSDGTLLAEQSVIDEQFAYGKETLKEYADNLIIANLKENSDV